MQQKYVFRDSKYSGYRAQLLKPLEVGFLKLNTIMMDLAFNSAEYDHPLMVSVKDCLNFTHVVVLCVSHILLHLSKTWPP